MEAETFAPTGEQLAQQASADRIADVLLLLETSDARRFTLTGLADEHGPFVGARFNGRTTRLTPAEARFVAKAIRFEGAGRYAGLLASLFDSAACDAEAIADPDSAARRRVLDATRAA